MKFKAPGAEPLMIALTSGHTCLIDPEGTEIPSRFQREAIARGCTVVGLSETADPEGESFDRTKVITEAINTMLASSDPADFTKDGKPNLDRLSKAVGFNVERSERDLVWGKFEDGKA